MHPKSLHFLVLCLVSFVLSTFHYTGKLNNFDKVIYWGNVAAGIFAPTDLPALLPYFPEPRGWLRGAAGPSVYLPGMCLLAITVAIAAGNLRVGVSPVDSAGCSTGCCLGFERLYLLGARGAARRYCGTKIPSCDSSSSGFETAQCSASCRSRRSTCCRTSSVVAPAPYMKWSVLFLPFIPLTWAYAIVRYRLMDVDVIFQQGYVYTLATISSSRPCSTGCSSRSAACEDLSPSASWP